MPIECNIGEDIECHVQNIDCKFHLICHIAGIGNKTTVYLL